MAILWNGQLLRATFFPTQALDAEDLSDLWTIVSGGLLPEVDERRVRESFRRQGGRVDQEYYLELQIQPLRIDWFLTPASAEGESPKNDLGSFEPVLVKFMADLSRWLETSADVAWSRIALGGILASPVAGHREGYQLILDLVPSLRFDLADELSDLLYQINRPRASKAEDGLKINCLMKWSVGKQQMMNLAMPSGMPTLQSVGHEEFFGRLELDINTAPTMGLELKKDRVQAILEELAQFALAVAASGELF